MKNHGRNITSFFIGLDEYAREKFMPFWTEMKRRGEAKRREKDSQEQDNPLSDGGAIIERKFAEVDLARADDLEALKARVAVLEEKLKQRPPQ